MENSHRTGVSTFASRTSPSTDQSLQKSFHLSHAVKIEFKKISSPSENKKYTNAQPIDRKKTVAMQIPKQLTGKRFINTVERRPACNMGSYVKQYPCAKVNNAAICIFF
jgi:hypothetical protein